MTSATSTQPRAILAKGMSVLSMVQAVDTRTALSRALKEYVEPLSVTQPEGRTLRLLKVYDVWAEPEAVGTFPSAVVSPLGELEYDSADMANRVEQIGSNPTVALRRWANAKLKLQVQVWANDPEERLAFARALENAFNPGDNVNGFSLDVPYYFNARARYTPVSSMHEDDQESAQKRWRRFSMTVDAEIGAYAPIGFIPTLIPRISTTVDS